MTVMQRLTFDCGHFHLSGPWDGHLEDGRRRHVIGGPVTVVSPSEDPPELTSAELRRLATDPDFRPPGWTVQEIGEFRRLAQCARAAVLPTDLLNMRSLHVERDESRGPDGARAALSSGRIIHLTFNDAVTFEEQKP